MLLYIAIGLIVVVACAYFLFRRSPNRLVEDIINMPAQDRALVLVQATVWRLQWEADNPKYLGIYLDPWLFPREVCEKLFSDLLNTAVIVGNEARALNNRLSEMGVTEKLPQDDLNAIRAWGVTIGARIGKTKLDDVVDLWKSLHESETSIQEALKNLKARRQAANALGHGGLFLEGFAVEHVLQEAHRVPKLSRGHT